jgi:hypothetical protein
MPRVQRSSAVRRETFVGQDVFDDGPLALDDRAAADGGFVSGQSRKYSRNSGLNPCCATISRDRLSLVTELNTAEMRVLERDGGCQYLLQEQAGVPFSRAGRGVLGRVKVGLGPYRGEPQSSALARATHDRDCPFPGISPFLCHYG